MSSADPGRRHAAEDELLAFCRRDYQSADYVRRTAEWIRDTYPGSAASLLPQLRRLYREKLAAGC